jgi:hypothetical protein
VGTQISDEELLSDLKRVAKEIGESPTATQYREHGEYSSVTIQERFDSWNKAKKQAELSANSPGGSTISDQEILQDLKSVAEQLGRSPTQSEYNDHGEYTFSTVSRRFGSWNKAKEEAGLSVQSNDKPKVPIEEIISDLEHGLNQREIADKYGYSSRGRISTRLREHGYKKRSRLSKNEAAYSGDRFSGILSIAASVLDELGISDIDETYYDMETFEEDVRKGLKIIFTDEVVKEVEDRGE